MKRKQKYRLSVVASLTGLLLIILGLKQKYPTHLYKSKDTALYL